MEITDTIEIEATTERVWALTTDIEAWPELSPTMTEVHRLDDGPLAVGSRAAVKQPAQRRRTWTVVELEPERTFVWSARFAGCTLTAGHHLEDTGPTGTRQTLRLDVEGPTAPIVGRLLARPVATALRQENEGFKQAAEAACLNRSDQG